MPCAGVSDMSAALQVILLSDDGQLIMQLHELTAEFQFLLTAEYLLELKFPLLVDGHERTVFSSR